MYYAVSTLRIDHGTPASFGRNGPSERMSEIGAKCESKIAYRLRRFKDSETAGVFWLAPTSRLTTLGIQKPPTRSAPAAWEIAGAGLEPATPAL
jgi:hypothetical protein